MGNKFQSQCVKRPRKHTLHLDSHRAARASFQPADRDVPCDTADQLRMSSCLGYFDGPEDLLVRLSAGGEQGDCSAGRDLPRVQMKR